MARCDNPKAASYKNYGDRGITVCKEWHDFYKFVEDVSPKPEDHQLDRVDNDKGYSKENCKWATAKQNTNNRRNTKYITYNGVTLSLSEWSEKVNVGTETLRARLRMGWSLKAVLFSTVNGT